MNNPQLAKEGENLASDFLVKQGLTIRERNFRCPMGEVDLILNDKKIIIFCEVKTRTNLNYGHPLEAITAQKLRRLSKIAQYYIGSREYEYRIDAIGIHYTNGQPEIEWIKNCTM